MARLPQFLSRLEPRQRAAAVGVVALAVVLVAALLVPRGGSDDDGALAPVIDPQYAARTTPAGPGTVSARDRAEVEEVIAQGEDCAVFEGQRYCLGLGWTEATSTVARRLEVPAGRETTGDLATSDLLAQRAAMDPAEREASERAELLAAARAVSKVVLLRHQLLGEPLPEGFLERHPEARATSDETASTSARTASAPKQIRDYPRRDTVLRPRQVRAQHTTYWCGPATMQMIAWGWQDRRRKQSHWADALGTTTSGTSITEMVNVVNRATGYDRESYAGQYIVLDVSDWSYRQWLLLQMRHIHDYRAPVVLHPILLQRFYPYLDDDASGHFQVGRGYDKRGRKPAHLGYFEPWDQQRFDPSEPRIARVQWRSAYQSYRANQAHPHQNIGV